LSVDLTGHFIYPGLINAHDHLEMNLYSKMGKPFYKNYVEWSKDIYKPGDSPIREIEKVDIKDRLLWGGLKNLISGVTTVVHHNPWNDIFESSRFPVKVFKEMKWAHSLAFGGNDVRKEFNDKIPFVIHAAEGIDDFAFSELSSLDSLGLLQKNTVLIHGVALERDSSGSFSNGKFSVVWCPASNHFMFGQTAPIERIKSKLRVALGTDSTMTGSATLLEEMCVAGQTHKASRVEIFDMVTVNAGTIFNLPAPEINAGQPADLFIVPMRKSDYIENLFSASPSDLAMVMVGGRVRLQSELIDKKIISDSYSVKISGERKLTDVDVSSLKKRIEKIVPKSALEKNPLWSVIEI
jgi:cytosine/adenosine deaminase-related metal-dependent hydrolase